MNKISGLPSIWCTTCLRFEWGCDWWTCHIPVWSHHDLGTFSDLQLETTKYLHFMPFIKLLPSSLKDVHHNCRQLLVVANQSEQTHLFLQPGFLALPDLVMSVPGCGSLQQLELLCRAWHSVLECLLLNFSCLSPTIQKMLMLFTFCEAQMLALQRKRNKLQFRSCN